MLRKTITRRLRSTLYTQARHKLTKRGEISLVQRDHHKFICFNHKFITHVTTIRSKTFSTRSATRKVWVSCVQVATFLPRELTHCRYEFQVDFLIGRKKKQCELSNTHNHICSFGRYFPFVFVAASFKPAWPVKYFFCKKDRAPSTSKNIKHVQAWRLFLPSQLPYVGLQTRSYTQPPRTPNFIT